MDYWCGVFVRYDFASEWAYHKTSGEKKLLPDVFLGIKAFEMKLRIEERKLTHFPFCKGVFEICGEGRFARTKKKTLENYKTAWIRVLIKINWFSLSFQSNCFPKPFQSRNQLWKEFYNRLMIRWKVPLNHHTRGYFICDSFLKSSQKVRKFVAAGMMTVFASIYIWEQPFSFFNIRKNKFCSKLTHESATKECHNEHKSQN